jgi:hypothetical protein
LRIFIESVTVLVDRGSTVYLLPETADPSRKGKKHPDAIVDGFITGQKKSGSCEPAAIRETTASHCIPDT